MGYISTLSPEMQSALIVKGEGGGRPHAGVEERKEIPPTALHTGAGQKKKQRKQLQRVSACDGGVTF